MDMFQKIKYMASQHDVDEVEFRYKNGKWHGSFNYSRGVYCSGGEDIRQAVDGLFEKVERNYKRVLVIETENFTRFKCASCNKTVFVYPSNSELILHEPIECCGRFLTKKSKAYSFLT